VKGFALFAAFFLIVSCSDGDKFSGEKNQQIRIEGIDYEISNGKLYLLGILQTEIKNCVSSNNLGSCAVNNCWIINDGKYSYTSLRRLDACYLSNYIWIIDNDEIYGEHFVKLILVDVFGDSISYSTSIRVDEPLRITLLSPIDDYEASKTEDIKYQYHISGIDKWEEGDWRYTIDTVDETEQFYDWRVKVFNQDTIYSEIRRVWIKD